MQQTVRFSKIEEGEIKKDLIDFWRKGADLRGKKTLFVVAAGAAGKIVTIPQTTSSALLRVFDLQIRDWKPI